MADTERRELNWAVLGCGVIAHQMGDAFAAMGRKIYAVGNRTHEKAVRFAEEYGVSKVYDDFHEMFSDPDVDIIYITTPHNTHITFLRDALANGKHVLCEKSITLNSAELEEAKALARKHRVALAEAQTIYHMPLYRTLTERLEAGEFGRVNVITMNFGSYKEYNMKNRFFNKALAGGAMLDIGVYALSCARLFLASSPDQFQTMMKQAPSGSDEQSVTILQNREGQMVTMALTMHSKQPKRAMISCDKCYIEIMEYPRAQKAMITWTADGHTEDVEAGETEKALVYELTDMEKAVRGDSSVMKTDFTTDVMRLMTDIRYAWGYYYDGEMR